MKKGSRQYVLSQNDVNEQCHARPKGCIGINMSCPHQRLYVTLRLTTSLCRVEVKCWRLKTLIDNLLRG